MSHDVCGSCRRDRCWGSRGRRVKRAGGWSAGERDNRRCPPGLTSVAEEHYLSHRERVGVRDRHERSLDEHALRAARGGAVELQARRTAAATHDFDVLPQDPLRFARAERFHRGFLRGEASRKMRSRIPPPDTICNLAGREHALQEPLAVLIEDLGNARNVGRVEANSEDVHGRTPA